MFGRKKHNNLLALYTEEAKEDILDALNWRRHYQRRRLILILTYAVWALILVLGVLLVNLLLFLPGLKNIYYDTLSGKNELEKITFLASAGDWSGAKAGSQRAVTDFDNSLSALKKISYSPLGWLPFTHGKLSDASALVEAGSLVSRAAGQALTLSEQFFAILPDKNATNLAVLKPEQKKALVKLIADSEPALLQAQSRLQAADKLLAGIKNRQLLAERGVMVEELSARLQTANEQLQQALSLARILPPLVGYPAEANYLIILQNQDELRPTGGFIGTYALLKAQDGNIVRLTTHDVYHLDMPVLAKYRRQPPAELKKYLNVEQWYFRDANWSPDWPTTAQRLIEIYQAENALRPQPEAMNKFNFVVGLTPELIKDLMSLTGNLTAGGQTYTADNLVALLQDTTGRDYAKFGVSAWDRKNVIGLLARDLENKLLVNVNKNWQPFLAIIKKNLEQKDLLVYSTESKVAEAVATAGYQGEIKATSGDYLMIVDANMAALKTDAVVNKSLVYNLTESEGALLAHAEIRYANTGRFTWKTTRYRSFVRLYAPLGSELIKVAGHSGGPADIVTGEEAGRTYFGALVEIEPGKIGGLSFDYKLPYNLYTEAKKGSYNLWVQKQPGAKISQLELNLKFGRPIKAYEPTGLYSTRSNNRLSWQGEFLTDKQFKVKF